MNILIAGAGPAGLGFAALMAESDRGHRITVLERNAPSHTPGWGITVRNHALRFLELDRRIDGQRLEGRALRYQGTLAVDLQYPADVHLVTFPRTALIQALTARCSELGIQIHYEADAASLPDAALDGYDLVAACDGAHSSIRRRFAEFFRPTETPGRNLFAWLGAAVPFHKLTILLRHDHGAMVGWAYKYSAQLSTFILECSPSTAERLGLLKMAPEDLSVWLSMVFVSELEGHAVLPNRAACLQRYSAVSCERLCHRNVVLLGDAAHTTHFSQGFGTMFAFDDALALHVALARAPNMETGLAAYEETQKPKIAAFQATAAASMQWSENLLDAAERRDEKAVHALIAARWPGNAVTASPLDRTAIGAR